MRSVQTGRGAFPLISLIAILTISLVVNLPGLAISPLLGDLDRVFPHTSHLEIQLLTVLPNLFIIPFLLVTGKLSLSVNKVLLLQIGLAIYTLSAVLYFFATSMIGLIVISCLLGVGAGLVIPLAAGFIADYFVGKYRMKQLGIKSGIANFTLIFATMLVGWLGNKGWHLPFIVYLVPVIPLLLSPFIGEHFIQKHASLKEVETGGIAKSGEGERLQKEVTLNEAEKESNAKPLSNEKLLSNAKPLRKESAPNKATVPGKPEFQPLYPKNPNKLLAGIIALYFIITYAVIAISYYLPFAMQDYSLTSTDNGLVNSFFFLSITLPGFFLTFIIHILKGKTILVAVLCIALGLFMLGIFHSLFLYITGAFLVGAGYGIIQPIIYDKATYLSAEKNKATQYLSFIFCGNYVAITVSPFIMTLFQLIFTGNPINMPFIINGFIMVVLALIVLFFYKSTLFRVDPSLFEQEEGGM